MIPRHAEAAVRTALRDTPAVFVVGPRQAGKSTLVQAIRGRAYVTLDVATSRSAAASDPDGFVAQLPDPVALDEVQRVPDLFLALKASIDADRRPGRFLLTGSANFLLLPAVGDALPGRVEIVTLWPFSQGEIESEPDGFVDAMFARTLPAVPAVPTETSADDRIVRGGFPEVIARAGARRERWFEDYVTTLLEREIRDLARIENATELTTMVQLLAARNANVLNLADIARDARLAHPTARRYLRLLETIYLVRTIPAWSTNVTSRLVRSSKLVLCDSGLVAHLVGANARGLARTPTLRGGLLEGFVAMELTKQLGWSAVRPRLFHFRDRSGTEVDLVLEARDGRVVGIEVKASGTVRAEDFRGLKALAHLAGPRFVRGVVLHTGPKSAGFGRMLHALPVDAVWTLAKRRR